MTAEKTGTNSITKFENYADFLEQDSLLACIFDL